MHLRSNSAFTLAELLIALAILGVIATFTIPKVLQSQQDGKYKAMGKDIAAMITGAFSAYRNKVGTIPSSITVADLTPYMNYIKVETAATVDDVPTSGATWPCSGGGWACLKFQNGDVMLYDPVSPIGGTGPNNYLWFDYDPDGKASSTKAISFFLYYNGRLSTQGVYDGNPAEDPSWFSWN